MGSAACPAFPPGRGRPMAARSGTGSNPQGTVRHLVALRRARASGQPGLAGLLAGRTDGDASSEPVLVPEPDISRFGLRSVRAIGLENRSVRVEASQAAAGRRSVDLG